MSKFYLYKNNDDYVGMVNATSCELENGDCRVLIGKETIAYIKNVDKIEAE